MGLLRINGIKVLPIALCLVGCSPRIVEHIRIEHDTTDIANHVRDSIYFRDSIYIKEWQKGDTIRIVEYRDRWREKVKEVHDTITRHQTDTIAVERTIEKKVEQPIRGAKKIKIRAFWWLVAVALIGWRKEIYKLVKRYILR